jgi:hypothetical protein
LGEAPFYLNKIVTMNQQSTTITTTTTMPKVPAYTSMGNMSTDKAVDPSANQCQVHGSFKFIL